MKSSYTKHVLEFNINSMKDWFDFFEMYKNPTVLSHIGESLGAIRETVIQDQNYTLTDKLELIAFATDCRNFAVDCVYKVLEEGGWYKLCENETSHNEL